MPTGVYDRTKSKPNAGLFSSKKDPWNKGKTGIYSPDAVKNLSIHCKKNRPSWKGGKYKNEDGYVFTFRPEHPHCSSIGYVREHRLVVEKQIGRYLLQKEQVHHLGNNDDNRPEMLMAFSNDGAHKRFHHNIHVSEEEIIFDGRKLKGGNK